MFLSLFKCLQLLGGSGSVSANLESSAVMPPATARSSSSSFSSILTLFGVLTFLLTSSASASAINGELPFHCYLLCLLSLFCALVSLIVVITVAYACGSNFFFERNSSNRYSLRIELPRKSHSPLSFSKDVGFSYLSVRVVSSTSHFILCSCLLSVLTFVLSFNVIIDAPLLHLQFHLLLILLLLNALVTYIVLTRVPYIVITRFIENGPRWRPLRGISLQSHFNNNWSNANPLASSYCQASNSSELPISLTPPTATDQSAPSIQRAPNSFERDVDNISSTSNQFDSTQSPGSSKLQEVEVDSTSTNQFPSTQQASNPLELQVDPLSIAKQFASSSSDLQVDQISTTSNQCVSTQQAPSPFRLQVDLLSATNQFASTEQPSSSFVDLISTATIQVVPTQHGPNLSHQLASNLIKPIKLISTKQCPNSSNQQVDVISTATNQFASTEHPPSSSVDLILAAIVSTQHPNLSYQLAPNPFKRIKLSSTQQCPNSSNQQVCNPVETNLAELDRDCISEIINRLPTNEDFLSCKVVCCWWRSVCNSDINWTTKPQFPWLMLSKMLDSDMRSFFSFDRNKYCEIELQAANGRRCFGSPHGWIVTLGPDGEIQLLNPLSQDQENLPPLPVPMTGDWFHFVHKLMLFKPSANEFLVMAIYGSRKQLAYVTLGEREWNTVRGLLHVRDVAHLKDRLFYALHTYGTLVLIELNSRNIARTEFIALRPEGLNTPDEVYLVNSSSTDLLGVFRYRLVLESWPETENFLVYKFVLNADELNTDDDELNTEWEQLLDLGDCMIFVGDGNSWSISIGARNAINAKSNRIYYTDDYSKRQGAGEVTHSGRDVGVFSMASGEIELLNFSVDFPSVFSRPIWFTPKFISLNVEKIMEQKRKARDEKVS